MLDIEKELKEMDFSGLSKVKDSLFTELMKERNQRVELDEEELDFLAAAGNNLKKINDNQKILKE